MDKVQHYEKLRKDLENGKNYHMFKNVIFLQYIWTLMSSLSESIFFSI